MKNIILTILFALITTCSFGQIVIDGGTGGNTNEPLYISTDGGTTFQSAALGDSISIDGEMFYVQTVDDIPVDATIGEFYGTGNGALYIISNTFPTPYNPDGKAVRDLGGGKYAHLYGYEFNLTWFGATSGDGTLDDVQFRNSLEFLYANGGGKLFVDGRFDLGERHTIPYDSTAYVNNDGEAYGTANDIVIEGFAGRNWWGDAGTNINTGSDSSSLNWTGVMPDPDSCLLNALGIGSFRMEGVHLTTDTDSTHFLKFVQTVPDIVNNSFFGASANENASNTAIVIGNLVGSDVAVEGGINGTFNGFSGRITGNSFNRIEAGLDAAVYANGLNFTYNTYFPDCGGESAVRITSSTSPSASNKIIGNLVSGKSYEQVFYLFKANNNLFLQNDIYDIEADLVIFKIDSSQNNVIDHIFQTNGTFERFKEDGFSRNTNTLRSYLPGDTLKTVNNHQFHGTSLTKINQNNSSSGLALYPNDGEQRWEPSATDQRLRTTYSDDSRGIANSIVRQIRVRSATATDYEFGKIGDTEVRMISTANFNFRPSTNFDVSPGNTLKARFSSTGLELFDGLTVADRTDSGILLAGYTATGKLGQITITGSALENTAGNLDVKYNGSNNVVDNATNGSGLTIDRANDNVLLRSFADNNVYRVSPNQLLGNSLSASGTGLANRLPYFFDDNTLTTNANFTFDGTTLTGRLINVEQVLTVEPITRGIANGLTPANGMIIYISNGSGGDPNFTTNGFYKYEEGAWIKW